MNIFSNEMQVGELQTFMYSSNSGKRDTKNLGLQKIKLKKEILDSVLTKIKLNAEKKVEYFNMISEKCQVHWKRVKTLKDELNKLQEKKKNNNIARWKKFEETYPIDFKKKVRAEKELKNLSEFFKNFENEIKPKEESDTPPELDNAIKPFFRAYVNKPLDKSNAYRVSGYYLGKRIYISSGKINYSFLQEIAEVPLDKFNELYHDKID